MRFRTISIPTTMLIAELKDVRASSSQCGILKPSSGKTGGSGTNGVLGRVDVEV